MCSFSRITDLTEQLHGQEEKARTERDGLLDRLHEINTESTTIRLENQSLKVSSVCGCTVQITNLCFFTIDNQSIYP